MIIDLTYFEGPLRIDGLVVSEGTAVVNTAQEAISNNVKYYIDTYEKKYLKSLLGFTLSERFIEYIKSNSKDNKEFNSLLSELKEKPSPIAQYVYFQYCKVETSISVVSKADNEDVRRILAHTGDLMCYAWNSMVDKNKSIISGLNIGKSIDVDLNILSYVNNMNI